MITKTSVISLVIIGLLTGCSSIHETFYSFNKNQVYAPSEMCKPYKNKIYAGVRRDAGGIVTCVSVLGWGYLICPYSLIDLPFSTVSDTVLLPYTTTVAIKNSGKLFDPKGEACDSYTESKYVGTGVTIEPSKVQSESFVEANTLILKNMILSSRSNAYSKGVDPLPLTIRQNFSGFFPHSVMSARWRVGAVDNFTLQPNVFHFGDREAITLATVIVFRNSESANTGDANLQLWAHQLAHVEQFLTWGFENFTERYLRNSQEVETAANERASQFMAFYASQLTPPIESLHRTVLPNPSFKRDALKRAP